MRIPNSTHEAHPWVMSRIASDFKLLDVWELPAEGGPDDFGTFLEIVAALDPTKSGSASSRFLFAVRDRLGALFGWDDAEERPIPGHDETSLAARLPAELRGSATGPQLSGALKESGGGFVPLFRTDGEWAAEISNATVHGVLQVAWVAQGEDRYRPHLGIYVKTRGRLGKMYLLLIDPFRHLIVYPALMRQVKRAWDARGSESTQPLPPPSV